MTLHIHVGHNTPGYLPESDVMCFDSVDDALEALRHEIKDQQEEYLGMCESNMPEGCEDAWCATAGDCMAALSATADGDAAYRLTKGQKPGLFGIRLSPPEGADVAHWAEIIETDRDSCEIAEEQGE